MSECVSHDSWVAQAQVRIYENSFFFLPNILKDKCIVTFMAVDHVAVDHTDKITRMYLTVLYDVYSSHVHWS